MSIETLLEAAKFLELQAQQQQKARGMLAFYDTYTVMYWQVVTFGYLYMYIYTMYVHIRAAVSLPWWLSVIKSNKT